MRECPADSRVKRWRNTGGFDGDHESVLDSHRPWNLLTVPMRNSSLGQTYQTVTDSNICLLKAVASAVVITFIFITTIFCLFVLILPPFLLAGRL